MNTIIKKAKAALYDTAASAIGLVKKVVPASPDMEASLKMIISHHGFYSNTVTGFSCYIPDKEDYPREEGLLLWNYSERYERVETQIQKYATEARVHRMKEMLGIEEEEYAEKFFGYIKEYTESLVNTGLFEPIGGGVELFGNNKVYNVAAPKKVFRSAEDLRKLEKLTVYNPVTSFCEEQGYFKAENKTKLLF